MNETYFKQTFKIDENFKAMDIIPYSIMLENNHQIS